jgi:hypothetical protein
MCVRLCELETYGCVLLVIYSFLLSKDAIC